MFQNAARSTLAPFIHPGLFLFLLGTLDTVVGFFQAKDGFDRAGRADAAFSLKRTRGCFPGNTEQELTPGPHAFIIRGTGFADAFFPVLFNDVILFGCHEISLPVFVVKYWINK